MPSGPFYLELSFTFEYFEHYDVFVSGLPARNPPLLFSYWGPLLLSNVVPARRLFPQACATPSTPTPPPQNLPGIRPVPNLEPKTLTPKLISQKVLIKSFCKSRFPHKSVNVSFI